VDASKLPARLMLDTQILVLALEHQSVKHANNPSTALARKLWEIAIGSRRTRVLIAAPSVFEFRVSPSAPPLPRLANIEYVAYSAVVAEDMSKWASPHVLKPPPGTKETTRNIVRYDALIVACAAHWKADLLVSEDNGMQTLADAARVQCVTLDYFLESQPNLFGE